MRLCLDLSTTHMGYSVFSGSNFIEAGTLDLSSDQTIFERLDLVLKKINDLNLIYKFEKVYIEKYAMAFGANNKKMQSSIHTLMLLANFIETVNYCLYKNNLSVEFVNVKTCRKGAGCNVPKDTDRQRTKDFVLNFVQNKFPVEKCAILYEKKRTGNPKDHCYDAADAIIIGLATI